jgi:hypothetical protein
VLANRLWERARRLGLRERLLARRGQSVRDRRPVVLVPGMCGTRLTDERGAVLWGSTAALYFGRGLTRRDGVRPGGLLRELTLVPGLLAYDVFGGLVRALGRAGFVEGEDLFVLDYDWREGVAAGARALAELIARIRGFIPASLRAPVPAGRERRQDRAQDRVDLVAISTGGLVARAYLGYGGADPLASGAPLADAPAVARVIYVGAPQRGSFDALACLHRGFRFAPAGHLFSPGEAAACQMSWDALPHPDEPVFVDQRGEPLELDLYDPELWSRLRLGDPRDAAQRPERLARARALHLALDRAPAQPAAETVVIGACHLPTPARVLVRDGGAPAYVPPPVPRRDDPFVGYVYRPGDGELPETSLRGLPGLPADRVWQVRPRKHAALPSDPAVHRLVIEALLATERFIPSTDLRRKPSLSVLRD